MAASRPMSYSARLCVLAALALVLCLAPADAAVRKYYIRAEDVEWDFLPSGKNIWYPNKDMYPYNVQTVYNKTRFIQYTDDSFKTQVEQPATLGILGPVLRACQGDTVEVLFENAASGRSYAMHPHGLFYNRSQEGAAYGGVAPPGSRVAPGERFRYHWLADDLSAPAPDAHYASQVWLYHSHADFQDVDRGLIGMMVVTRAADCDDATAKPTDVDEEVFTHFHIFDETTVSTPKQGGYENDDDYAEGNLKHSINGHIWGNTQGITVHKCAHARWYLTAMGTEDGGFHTAHWHGERVNMYGRITDVAELMPASMVTVNMLPRRPGHNNFHCHLVDHEMAGMGLIYTTAPTDEVC